MFNVKSFCIYSQSFNSKDLEHEFYDYKFKISIFK